MTEKGILHIVGVGPGDPELMTLRAFRLIGMAHDIAYFVDDEGNAPAHDTAAPFLPEEARLHALKLPPCGGKNDDTDEKIGSQLASILDQGMDVVFLIEGDPLFYGRGSAIYALLQATHVTEFTPGVTSVSACAAETRSPLCRGDDVFKVLSATLPAERLIAELATTDAAAIIKAGSHLPKLKETLAKAGLEERATAISCATLPEQQLLPFGTVAATDRLRCTTILLHAEKHD